MSKPTRPIVRYFGGKWRAAPKIIAEFPEHSIYVEPFCGAASVLARKDRVKTEVINDMNSRLISLFRSVRTRDPEELCRLLRWTLYSDEEYKAAKIESGDPLEDARRMILLGFQGRGSACSANDSSGWRRGISNNHDPSKTWAKIEGMIEPWRDRLQGVNIENKCALSVIPHWDREGTLFYVDPPYVHKTRKSSKGYKFEMVDEDHKKLACVLNEVKGKVCLSGYHSDLYDELYKDWRTVNFTAATDKSGNVKEVLWMNY